MFYSVTVSHIEFKHIEHGEKSKFQSTEVTIMYISDVLI